MRSSIFAAGMASAFLLVQAGAIAQTNTPDHVRDVLQKQGFTDVRVVPQSFIIHAKDKDGNPVVMSVTPDSIAAVTVVGPRMAPPTRRGRALVQMSRPNMFLFPTMMRSART